MRRVGVAAGDRRLLGRDLVRDRVEPDTKRSYVALDLAALAGVELQACDQLQLIPVLAERFAADRVAEFVQRRLDVRLLVAGARGEAPSVTEAGPPDRIIARGSK